MRYFSLFWINCMVLVSAPLISAQELPMEPEANEVAGQVWEIGSAPDAPWGVKPMKTKSIPAAPAQAKSTVPAPTIHVVQPKETLSSIARTYKTTVEAIRKINVLRGDNLLIGQKLAIPGKPSATTPKDPLPIQTGPAPKPTVNATATQRAETVRLQVFLDRVQFCPGRIDGLSGRFMISALKRYQMANPEMADESELFETVRQEVPRPYTTYKLRESDFSFINDFPSGWPAMAAQTFLTYRTAWEFVAERYHVSEDFLKAINPHLAQRSFQPGDTFLVPNVVPFFIENSFPKRSSGLFTKKGLPVTAIIRQGELMLELVRGQELLACFPITLGKPETRGKGDWTIVAKTPRPNYNKRPRAGDPADAKGKRFIINPGPNNPVGVLWITLQKPGARSTSSQGLHGTYTPDTIGRATSLGCIRLANWDIVRAAALLEPGTTISWR